MPQYKVTKPCYFDGVYRTPSKHNIVDVQKKFTKKNQPSYLELIDEESAQPDANKPDNNSDNDADQNSEQGSGDDATGD